MLYNRSLPVGKFVNQFPCESVITCKDLLVTVAQRAAKDDGLEQARPAWLPMTYNLHYELPQMIKEYMIRQEK